MRRPTERARVARASVAAASGEQGRLGGVRPRSRRGHGRVTAQRSTAQETCRVQRRRRRPPRRAAAECRAVAKAAADRAGASSARERRRDERRAAANRRRAAVEPSRPLACDRAEKHGARDAPRSAQEAKVAASSGGRVSSRRETRRLTERARAARASVAATSGEQQRLDGDTESASTAERSTGARWRQRHPHRRRGRRRRVDAAAVAARVHARVSARAHRRVRALAAAAESSDANSDELRWRRRH